MTQSISCRVVLIGLAVSFASVVACSSNESKDLFSDTAGNEGGASGTQDSGGSGGLKPSETKGGQGGSGGQSGGSSGTVGGKGGEAGTAGNLGTGGAGGMAGSAGAGGTAGKAPEVPANDIKKIVPTEGCGKDPGQALGRTVRGTIQTSGTKGPDAADQKKGDWSYLREYFVILPATYDKTKAYPLVFQGPGCGSNGTKVYNLDNGVGGTVIRVGLTPPPNEIGHSTAPGGGCFDDKEGDDSVDWPFYENLYDKLAGQLCFDRNRVFVSGNSSGGWLSNEMGCKYAGDAKRPIRGIMPNTGGLPTDPRHVPTCTNNPMAGMWVHELGDGGNPFTGTRVSVARAMKVNGCTIGTNFDNAMFDDFPIGGGNPANICKKIKGCPELYPLVVCALAGNGHGTHDDVANPGFATFLKLFSSEPFVTR